MILQSTPAVITGGASGLGAATARHLAAAGAKVTIFDLNDDQGRRLARELGGRFARVDVTSDDEVAQALAEAEDDHGIARILVNCAGVGVPAVSVGDVACPHRLGSFRSTVEVDLIGTYHVASKFAARLARAEPIAGERGVIINTASIAAFDGQIGQCSYSASKAAIVGMTLPMARDLASVLIRVVTIAPGMFMTPLLEGLTPTILNSLSAQVPMPARIGRPEEFAELAAQIVANGFINGETIRIDGAMRMGPS